MSTKGSFYQADNTVYTETSPAGPASTPNPVPLTDDGSNSSFFAVTGKVYDAVDFASAAAKSAADALADRLLADTDAANAHADRLACDADVVICNADVVTCNNDVTSSNANASAASASATAASGSASAASASATAASGSATAASGSATAASGSATAASGSATAASGSATAAAGSATSALADLNALEQRYLGAFAAGPTLDNQGNALITGALYWDTVKLQMYVYSGSAWVVMYNNTFAATFVIDGGGSAPAVNSTCDLYLPFAATIVSATLQSDISGSAVVDVWALAGINAPTVTNTITASALPTLSSAQAAQDNTLTGWTTAVASGTSFRANLNSVTTCTRLTLTLTLKKT